MSQVTALRLVWGASVVLDMFSWCFILPQPGTKPALYWVDFIESSFPAMVMRRWPAPESMLRLGEDVTCDKKMSSRGKSP